MKNFHLKGYGMTASQNGRMTAGQGKSSIAPTFSRRGYNKRQYEKMFLTCSLAVCLSPGSVFACINNSCSADIIILSGLALLFRHKSKGVGLGVLSSNNLGQLPIKGINCSFKPYYPCENEMQLCVKAAEKPAFLQLFCAFLRKLQKSCRFF